MLSPPSGRRGSGGGGWQAGGVVVPAGAGLVASAPCGPAEAEGEAGAADEACFPVAGQALDAGGLGGGQPDREDAGRAGLAARAGSGASPVEHSRSAVPSAGSLMAGSLTAAGAAGGAAGRLAPASADWMAAVRSWARAVSAVCRQIASYFLAWHWSQPRVSFPVLKVVSTGHLRPAMVMK